MSDPDNDEKWKRWQPPKTAAFSFKGKKGHPPLHDGEGKGKPFKGKTLSKGEKEGGDAGKAYKGKSHWPDQTERYGEKGKGHKGKTRSRDEEGKAHKSGPCHDKSKGKGKGHSQPDVDWEDQRQEGGPLPENSVAQNAEQDRKRKAQRAADLSKLALQRKKEDLFSFADPKELPEYLKKKAVWEHLAEEDSMTPSNKRKRHERAGSAAEQHSEERALEPSPKRVKEVPEDQEGGMSAAKAKKNGSDRHRAEEAAQPGTPPKGTLSGGGEATESQTGNEEPPEKEEGEQLPQSGASSTIKKATRRKTRTLREPDLPPVSAPRTDNEDRVDLETGGTTAKVAVSNRAGRREDRNLFDRTLTNLAQAREAEKPEQDNDPVGLGPEEGGETSSALQLRTGAVSPTPSFPSLPEDEGRGLLSDESDSQHSTSEGSGMSVCTIDEMDDLLDIGEDLQARAREALERRDPCTQERDRVTRVAEALAKDTRSEQEVLINVCRPQGDRRFGSITRGSLSGLQIAPPITLGDLPCSKDFDWTGTEVRKDFERDAKWDAELTDLHFPELRDSKEPQASSASRSSGWTHQIRIGSPHRTVSVEEFAQPEEGQYSGTEEEKCRTNLPRKVVNSRIAEARLRMLRKEGEFHLNSESKRRRTLKDAETNLSAKRETLLETMAPLWTMVDFGGAPRKVARALRNGLEKKRGDEEGEGERAFFSEAALFLQGKLMTTYDWNRAREVYRDDGTLGGVTMVERNQGTGEEVTPIHEIIGIEATSARRVAVTANKEAKFPPVQHEHAEEKLQAWQETLGENLEEILDNESTRVDQERFAAKKDAEAAAAILLESIKAISEVTTTLRVVRMAQVLISIWKKIPRQEEEISPIGSEQKRLRRLKELAERIPKNCFAAPNFPSEERTAIRGAILSIVNGTKGLDDYGEKSKMDIPRAFEGGDEKKRRMSDIANEKGPKVMRTPWIDVLKGASNERALREELNEGIQVDWVLLEEFKKALMRELNIVPEEARKRFLLKNLLQVLGAEKENQLKRSDTAISVAMEIEAGRSGREWVNPLMLLHHTREDRGGEPQLEGDGEELDCPDTVVRIAGLTPAHEEAAKGALKVILNDKRMNSEWWRTKRTLIGAKRISPDFGAENIANPERGAAIERHRPSTLGRWVAAILDTQVVSASVDGSVQRNRLQEEVEADLSAQTVIGAFGCSSALELLKEDMQADVFEGDEEEVLRRIREHKEGRRDFKGEGEVDIILTMKRGLLAKLNSEEAAIASKDIVLWDSRGEEKRITNATPQNRADQGPGIEQAMIALMRARARRDPAAEKKADQCLERLIQQRRAHEYADPVAEVLKSLIPNRAQPNRFGAVRGKRQQQPEMAFEAWDDKVRVVKPQTGQEESTTASERARVRTMQAEERWVRPNIQPMSTAPMLDVNVLKKNWTESDNAATREWILEALRYERANFDEHGKEIGELLKKEGRELIRNLPRDLARNDVGVDLARTRTMNMVKTSHEAAVKELGERVSEDELCTSSRLLDEVVVCDLGAWARRGLINPRERARWLEMNLSLVRVPNKTVARARALARLDLERDQIEDLGLSQEQRYEKYHKREIDEKRASGSWAVWELEILLSAWWQRELSRNVEARIHELEKLAEYWDEKTSPRHRQMLNKIEDRQRNDLSPFDHKEQKDVVDAARREVARIYGWNLPGQPSPRREERISTTTLVLLASEGVEKRSPFSRANENTFMHEARTAMQKGNTHWREEKVPRWITEILARAESAAVKRSLTDGEKPCWGELTTRRALISAEPGRYEKDCREQIEGSQFDVQGKPDWLGNETTYKFENAIARAAASTAKLKKLQKSGWRPELGDSRELTWRSLGIKRGVLREQDFKDVVRRLCNEAPEHSAAIELLADEELKLRSELSSMIDDTKARIAAELKAIREAGTRVNYGYAGEKPRLNAIRVMFGLDCRETTLGWKREANISENEEMELMMYTESEDLLRLAEGSAAGNPQEAGDALRKGNEDGAHRDEDERRHRRRRARIMYRRSFGRDLQPSQEKLDRLAIQEVLSGGEVPSVEMSLIMETPAEQRTRMHRALGVNPETPGALVDRVAFPTSKEIGDLILIGAEDTVCMAMDMAYRRERRTRSAAATFVSETDKQEIEMRAGEVRDVARSRAAKVMTCQMAAVKSADFGIQGSLLVCLAGEEQRARRDRKWLKALGTTGHADTTPWGNLGSWANTQVKALRVFRCHELIRATAPNAALLGGAEDLSRVKADLREEGADTAVETPTCKAGRITSTGLAGRLKWLSAGRMLQVEEEHTASKETLRRLAIGCLVSRLNM